MTDLFIFFCLIIGGEQTVGPKCAATRNIHRKIEMNEKNWKQKQKQNWKQNQKQNWNQKKKKCEEVKKKSNEIITQTEQFSAEIFFFFKLIKTNKNQESAKEQSRSIQNFHCKSGTHWNEMAW